MSRRTATRYTGKLAERLPAPKIGEELLSDELWSEINDRGMLLFDHYEILRPNMLAANPVDSWGALAMALAMDNVPGFQFLRRGGRPGTWSERPIVTLYVDVRLRVLKGQTESQACFHLAGKEPWKSFIQSRERDQTSMGHTLLRRFKEIQEQNHAVVKLAEKVEQRWPDEVETNLKLISQRYGW